MVAQLVHVRVVLGHDGDGIALLPDDETSLLLRSVPQVDAIILLQEERWGTKHSKGPVYKRGLLQSYW